MTDQNVIKPRTPMFILTIINATYNAAKGFGIKIKEMIITAKLDKQIDEIVFGKTALYCSAN